MNKEVFSYLITSIALVVGAIFYSDTIQSPIISTLNSLKTSYHNTNHYIEQSINKHFYQAQEIENLKQKILQYKNNHIVMLELAHELQDIFNEQNSTLESNPQVELVRTISYAEFGDFNRLWMNIPEYNSSKIYGLTYKEYVAGIVINKNNKPLALLNRDIKSTYAVYVGKQSAPGIAHGNQSKNIMVKFIPAWFSIKKGDEVISSGLDTIFTKGLKVGKVLSVSSSQGYQNAVVEPYYQSSEPHYFHMIRSVQ